MGTKKTIKCSKCGEQKQFYCKEMCKTCYGKERYKNHKERINEYRRNRRYKLYGIRMKENKDCSSFLGIYVAEQVLSKVFKDVKQMPNGNVGFDFKCSKGMKIDVKSSVLRNGKKYTGKWVFTIRKNTIADYFLCLAFDNRKDLNPLYIWLIPGEVLNHLSSTTISKSTLSKWKKYEKDINKVVDCCDSMKKFEKYIGIVDEIEPMIKEFKETKEHNT